MARQAVVLMPSTGRRLVNRWAALVIPIAVAACTVGPDYRQPDLPPNASLTDAPLPERTAGAGEGAAAAQTFALGRDLPHDWWSLFGSRTLSDMVARALAANADLAAAQATLKQTQENALAARSGLFPSLGAKVSGSRIGFSGESIGQSYTEVFTLNTSQLSISYPLDLFGGTRRQIEIADAQVNYQRFQLEAASITLATNVVVTAIQEASLRAQLAATEEIVAGRRRILEMMRRQASLGGAAGADVLAQETALAQAEATLPGLQRQVALQRDQLNVLMGRFPGEAYGPLLDLGSLKLPAEIPVSLPSSLVDQRPDVRASAAQLHAATAQVGVAISAMLPQLTLSAMGGSITLGQLFRRGTMIWDFGFNLSQPLFQGGQLLHQRRAADAGLEAAVASYRSAVLGAFRNVADALHALRTDADAVLAQRASERTAAASVALSEAQYRAGATSFLTLLNAQIAHAQARIALIQAEAARFADMAALYQALGGGWWNRPKPDDGPGKG